MRLLCDASRVQLAAIREVDALIADLAARPHDLISPLTIAARLKIAIREVALVPMRGEGGAS